MADESTEAALRREIYLDQVTCSFCGKRGRDVESIICGATPTVAICNECVDVCREIIDQERGGE
ncbi:MAG TPA: ClpX C4-type zinc finger protein [Solirubrobacteraceae bacterium]|nr:ClpX C4-type zinc finger protein [Solirubrobacteraceae bacterium]